MTAYPSRSHAPTRFRPWCCFRSGARSYAVDLKSVVEVIETEGLVRLPHGPSGVLGLCAFRRDVIPVVRLDSGPDRETTAHGRTDVLILRTEQGCWGLRIDRSGTAVIEDYLEEDPDLDPEASPGPTVLIGTLRKGDMVCSVIDPESTWQRLRAAIERDFRNPLMAAAGAPSALAEGIPTGSGGGG